jgi:nucleotide-binding universal stress UspA family protein
MTEQQNDTGQRIVVGVDGSSSSRAALRWAVRQAKLTGASVETLTAWRAPTLVGLGGQFTEVDASGGEDGTIKASAESMLRAEIDEVAGPSDGAQIKAQVGEGSAAQLLLNAAEGATMVVVGSRGHGGITGTLLGSVGQTLAQHAPCPVLIIRGPA